MKQVTENNVFYLTKVNIKASVYLFAHYFQGARRFAQYFDCSMGRRLQASKRNIW